MVYLVWNDITPLAKENLTLYRRLVRAPEAADFTGVRKAYPEYFRDKPVYPAVPLEQLMSGCRENRQVNKNWTLGWECVALGIPIVAGAARNFQEPWGDKEELDRLEEEVFKEPLLPLRVKYLERDCAVAGTYKWIKAGRIEDRLCLVPRECIILPDDPVPTVRDIKLRK